MPTADQGLQWWEFKFYHCQRYSLNYFLDDDSGGLDSVVIDDRTGG